MNCPVAHNVTAKTIRDAARLAIPTWRAMSSRRVRRLAGAQSHQERDELMRRWSRQLVRALDVRVTADGMEHATGGPFLVVALHEGLIDVPIVIDSLTLPLTFVARSELAAERPFKGLLEASRQILINPESPSALRTMLRETSLTVAQGRSVVTFPQGSVLGLETAFQPGAWHVASRLDLPILPVAIWGTHRVWQHPFSPTVQRHQEVRLAVLPPRRLASPDGFRELERELKAVTLADESVPPRRYVPGRDGFWDGYKFEIDPDYPELAAEVAEHRMAAAAT